MLVKRGLKLRQNGSFVLVATIPDSLSFVGSWDRRMSNTFVRITVRNMSKRTSISLDYAGTPSWNDILVFPVVVSALLLLRCSLQWLTELSGGPRSARSVQLGYGGADAVRPHSSSKCFPSPRQSVKTLKG